MNPVNIQKMAASFGLFSFGFLCIGSILMGATVLTGIIRGMVGAVVFALVVWLSGIILLQEDDGDSIEGEDQTEDVNKGAQLDQRA
tara:strand:- start:1681 stop:1938 length:258 start_codon:yes stop_codon:yes gene_type:complete